MLPIVLLVYLRTILKVTVLLIKRHWKTVLKLEVAKTLYLVRDKVAIW